MRAHFLLTIAALAFGSACSSTGSTTTPIGEPPTLAGMTAAHNSARSSVVPAASPPLLPLVWDDTLAADAQSWANKCQPYPESGLYGQNVYYSNTLSTPSEVVAQWVSESSAYDYATNACSGNCLDYRQVVLRKTERLGCGVSSCAPDARVGGGAWQIWVCSYDPTASLALNRPY